VPSTAEELLDKQTKPRVIQPQDVFAHSVNQVDLIAILQEFIEENDRRIKILLLLLGRVHNRKVRHQNFRCFLPHHHFESPSHPYLMMEYADRCSLEGAQLHSTTRPSAQ